jgi:hypothetical protein
MASRYSSPDIKCVRVNVLLLCCVGCSSMLTRLSLGNNQMINMRGSQHRIEYVQTVEH